MLGTIVNTATILVGGAFCTGAREGIDEKLGKKCQWRCGWYRLIVQLQQFNAPGYVN